MDIGFLDERFTGRRDALGTPRGGATRAEVGKVTGPEPVSEPPENLRCARGFGSCD